MASILVRNLPDDASGPIPKKELNRIDQLVVENIVHTGKTQLSRLIARVERGEEVMIARGKKPVARLIAYRSEEQKRGFGSMKGLATIGPEFWEPLPERS